MRRLVWPCSVDGCRNLCDPEIGVTLLCSVHGAMVPAWMFAEIDDANSSGQYEAACDAVTNYAAAADVMINGDG